MDITKDQIAELRRTFLQQLDSKENDVIHNADLARIQTDDFWLQRFLMHHEGNLENALAMMWETVTWRKEFGANDINNLVKTELLEGGGFFPHGSDKDGCTLFVFKCKLYVKGAQSIDDLKRCVVYWFERLERQNKGKQITLFFDMEGCGLANMDMEFTKYLIGLFKQYYPYFLNYILIFEMPWILNAAFKIIKSWLPEKAVQKIKFVSKKDIKEYVPLDQALKCWGGQNEYTFSYVPEQLEAAATEPLSTSVSSSAVTSTPVSRKVHFAEGSMSDSPDGSGDKDHNEGNGLVVQPSAIITFVKEGDGELVSTLELHNTDPSAIISFKLKTTSPEKFRVRPSVGVLTPGGKAKIKVNLLPGFQLGGLSRDKFLVMSTHINSNEQDDLNHIWKDTSGRKVNQHRLKCAQMGDTLKNGNAISVSGGPEGDSNISNIVTKLNQLLDEQKKLNGTVKHLQHFQLFLVLMIIGLGVLMMFAINKNAEVGEVHCTRPEGL